MSETARGDAAAAVKAVIAYAEYCGGVHDDGCPEDDTCDCSGKWINDGVTAAVTLLKEQAAEIDRLSQALTERDGERERMRIAAYRQARVFEPSMEGYHAAMATYVAAFGPPDGEPEVILLNGERKQPWQLR